MCQTTFSLLFIYQRTVYLVNLVSPVVKIGVGGRNFLVENWKRHESLVPPFFLFRPPKDFSRKRACFRMSGNRIMEGDEGCEGKAGRHAGGEQTGLREEAKVGEAGAAGRKECMEADRKAGEDPATTSSLRAHLSRWDLLGSLRPIVTCLHLGCNLAQKGSSFPSQPHG